MMAVKAGPKGKVFAVDISKEFLDHITKSARDTNIGNIETVMATETSSNLKPDSIDLVFICDTYHHFEFPFKTMEGIHQALRKGGRLVVIDFERIEGKSKEWTLKHVRAGREVFQKEIEQAGFELKEAKKVEGLEENYFLHFVKKD
jgi:ubiquinone/menaquinone biosynthesis C-methylase UbiE